MAGQSRCCWNTWEGNLNQSWSQEVAWSRGQSSISLLINRPWCHVSCKSVAFQIPSRVFSLLIQCWRRAFEIWFGNIANTPGHLSQWATTTEPECPRTCDLLKRSTGLKTSVLQLQSSPCLLQIEKSWASDLVQPKKKKKILPEKPVWPQGKQDMTKDETSLGLISCKSWRGKLQPVFTWNLGHNLCLKRAQPKTMELRFHSPTSTSLLSCNYTKLVSPCPYIRSSNDKWKMTLEAKDTKAQENETSDDV